MERILYVILFMLHILVYKDFGNFSSLVLNRLLQEMGWHEHSDNEEGYAPLTEDEKKEFQKRKSQQVK